MKKLLIILALVAAAVVPAAVANTIKLTHGPYSLYPGGEFNAKAVGEINGTFNTFCVESATPFSINTIYSYTLGQTDHSGNTLKLGTAWLFNKFSTGSLTINSNALAGELQAAIWYFQGQSLDIPRSFPSGNPVNSFTNLAESMLGSSVWNASNGMYGVEIVKMSTMADGNAQSQLYDSVPDGGATMALLGLGLIAIGAFRRRRA